MKRLLIILSFALLLCACQQQGSQRKEISLNGRWKIAKTDTITSMPSTFESEAPVPGLVDMAHPAIDHQDTVYNKSVYWYKRTFTLDATNAGLVQLKILKARYHTRVYVNGTFAGENVYNFTPTLLDIKPLLKKAGEENELVIAVGCLTSLPDTVTNGMDFEKTKYIPGIYDEVKLIVTGYPYIANVQTVPDIKNSRLRVVAEILSGDDKKEGKISYVVKESHSEKVIARGSYDNVQDAGAGLSKVDFTVKMDSCHLWTPEDPFLYDLELSTSGDNTRTRFGMRTFEGTKDSGVFLLNGEPYYLRGTNVCIYRFFEDPDRKGLPWDGQWATKLHDQFKDMHWNSIRYCIGFPPEKWYDIADSIGLLIQDEYPIWTGGKGGFESILKKITSRQLAMEYTHWMRERWNHPCVVIWDAQNESVNDTTGKAIQQVRSLDLSNRPWDNGWAAPMSETDVVESHPYLFVKYMAEGVNPSAAGAYKDLLSENHLPDNDPNQFTPKPGGERYKNPVIINEYSWLWLNRDGSTTTLTDRVYRVAFPQAITTEQRFEAYAKATAILTEYWRASRQSAGILHFCGLGYSRSSKPRGQTSDNFIDLKNLTYEPQFYKYVKASFSPVGMMVELWDKAYKGGAEITVPVHVFNDTGEAWKGKMKLTLFGQEALPSQEAEVSLDKYEKKVISFQLKLPQDKGDYHIQSEIDFKGEKVISNRDFKIK